MRVQARWIEGRIAAQDDRGRERLVRYCTRPPFALSRIEVLRDGRLALLTRRIERATALLRDAD